MNYRDEFKVSFVKQPAYYVDEKKKSVKCYLTCDIKTPNALYGNQIMNNTRISATGYAKCGSQDEFNVHTGKKIALARAEEKIYLKAKHMAKQAKKDAEVFIKAADKFEQKCYRVCAHNEDYIDQFCLATHPNYVTPKQIANSRKIAQPRDAHGRYMSYETKDNSKSTNSNVIKIKINRI